MFKFSRKWLLFAFLVMLQPSYAGINNPGSASSGGGSNTGNAQIDIAQTDIQGGVLNAIDGANQLGFSGGASPSQLDVNGYPNTTLTSGQVVQYLMYFLDSHTGSSTQWTFSWTPGGAAVFFIQDTLNNVSILTPGNCTVSTTTVTISAGQTCTFTFNWSVLPGQNRLVQFQAAAYAPGSSKMILCRSSDLAAVQAGKYWTQEFLTLLTSMNLRTMRFYPVIGLNSLSNWAFRTTPATFGFFNSYYAPTAWSGGAGTSGQPTQVSDAFTLAPASSSPANWTDGEVLQGDFSAATSNTTTTPTLTITGHTGSKTIVQLNGNALSIGGIAAGSSAEYATFFYDSVLDKVLYVRGGMSPQLPVEYQVNLSNTLNVNLWTNIPAFASLSYVTSLGNYILSHLSSGLKTWYEYVDEMWNYAGPIGQWTTWADNRSTAMGLPGLGANSSWYALRSRMYMGTLTSVYAGRMSRLGRLLCVQTVAPSSAVDQDRFQGFGLAPNGTGTGGSGNSVYNTYTGSANYSQTVAAGGLGRPIDFTDAICPVSYWGGMIYTGDDGFTFDGGAAISPFNIINMQAALTDYTAPNTAAAFAILDNDYRQGTYDSQTVTASGTTFTLTGTGDANTTTTTSGLSTAAVTGGAKGIYHAGLSISDTAGNLQASTTISSVSGSYGSYVVNLSKTASGNGATTLIPMEFSVGTPVVFTTTGTLPTGISPNTPYFIKTITGVTFTIAASVGGTAISVSGGSGTHSVGAVNAGSFPLISSVCCAWGTNNAIYYGWETIITADGYPVTMQAYEGGLGTSAPTTAECTAMGVTATPLGGGAPTAQGCHDQSLQMLADYRNSSFASALALAGSNQFVGQDSTAKNFGLMTSVGWTPSWLTLSCNTTSQCPWQLLPGGVDSTPTQLFTGYQAYRHP